MNYNDKTREDLINEIEELQNANFHNLAESIQDGIVIANPAGQHLYVNRRAAEILLYSCEELLHLNMKDLAHSSVYPIMHKRLLDRIAGRPVPSTYEVLIRRKDGSCFLAEVTGTKTLWHGQECDLVVFRDITMRKKVEAELQQNRRELTILMDHLPGMVYSCLNDTNWTMTFVSEGSSDLTGYLPYELMYSKLSFNDIIHPDDQKMVWDTIQQALEKRTTYTLEYRIITKSGQIKHVWERGRGVFDEKSEFTKLI